MTMHPMRLIFIVLFITLALLLSIFAALQLWRGASPGMSWLGLLLAAASPLSFLLLKPLSRNQTEPLQAIGFSATSGLGLAITMVASWKHGDAAGSAHIWAAISLVSWLIYLKWFARKPVPDQDE
ncbi:MAG TPA: hypothetical protein VFG52_10615 [Xanthomonadales bacterium]|nr:hypothetical protein [Xanthomonadales bacterium]